MYLIQFITCVALVYYASCDVPYKLYVELRYENQFHIKLCHQQNKFSININISLENWNKSLRGLPYTYFTES